MTDLPKFEDVFRFKIISSTSKIRDIRIGWEACMSACEPIIAGLEKQLAERETADKNSVNAWKRTAARMETLEKQLAEAQAEVVEVFIAAGDWFLSWLDRAGVKHEESNIRQGLTQLAANRAKAEGARKGEAK